MMRHTIASLSLLLLGCGSGHGAANRPELAEKWFVRSQGHLQRGEINLAVEAAGKAIEAGAGDDEATLYAASLALARLEYAEAIRLSGTVTTTAARALRGRAYWYDGKLDQAAAELEQVLADPEAQDEWAKGIVRLARDGAGRTPFQISSATVATVDLVRVHPTIPFMVLPLEIDGESALTLVSTSVGEMTVDKAYRPEPSWVSIRVGGRLEMRDVPAASQDLSALSKQVGAPIRALVGVQVLRRLNATLDFSGRQFVARSYSPPPPPGGARLDVFYLRGGGLMLPIQLGGSEESKSALLVDTQVPFPLALDEGGFARAGVPLSSLSTFASDSSGRLKEGSLPGIKLAMYEVTKVPAVFGMPIQDIERAVRQDIDGLVGASLIAQFRFTFAEGGRTVWLEEDATRGRSSNPEGG